MTRREEVSELLLIFQDVPDADNFVSVADLLRSLAPAGSPTTVALVVTGRHADLSHPHVRQKQQFGERLAEDAAEVAQDSWLVLQDGARRMAAFLRSVGLFDRVTHFVVDPAFIPAVTPCASHDMHMHMLDFLFDRADLCGGAFGDIVTPEQYCALVRQLQQKNTGQAHRDACRDILATGAAAAGKQAGVRLAETALVDCEWAAVSACVLGPLTGVADVLSTLRCATPIQVTGLLFAYYNPTPFNVSCDPPAAVQFLDLVRASGPSRLQARFCPSESAGRNAPQQALEAALMTDYLAATPEQRRILPACHAALGAELCRVSRRAQPARRKAGLLVRPRGDDGVRRGTRHALRVAPRARRCQAGRRLRRRVAGAVRKRAPNVPGRPLGL